MGEHSPNWGGKRPGAGRPRSKDITAKVRSVYCSDSEHRAVKNFLRLYRACGKDAALRASIEDIPAGGLLGYFDGDVEVVREFLSQDQLLKLLE